MILNCVNGIYHDFCAVTLQATLGTRSHTSFDSQLSNYWGPITGVPEAQSRSLRWNESPSRDRKILVLMQKVTNGVPTLFRYTDSQITNVFLIFSLMHQHNITLKCVKITLKRRNIFKSVTSICREQARFSWAML